MGISIDDLIEEIKAVMESAEYLGECRPDLCEKMSCLISKLDEMNQELRSLK